MHVNISGDISQPGLFKKIESFANEFGLKVSYNETQSPLIKVEQIKKAIEKVTGLHFSQYSGPSKETQAYYCRMLLSHFCTEYKCMSLEEITEILNRDKSTMARCIKKFDEEVQFNRAFRELAEEVEKILIKVVSL